MFKLIFHKTSIVQHSNPAAVNVSTKILSLAQNEPLIAKILGKRMVINYVVKYFCHLMTKEFQRTSAQDISILKKINSLHFSTESVLFFQALKWNQTQLNPQTIYKRIKLCNIWICVNSVRIKCGAQCNEDKSKLNSCNNICFFDVMPSYRNIQNYKKIAIQGFRWKHM